VTTDAVEAREDAVAVSDTGADSDSGDGTGSPSGAEGRTGAGVASGADRPPGSADRSSRTDRTAEPVGRRAGETVAALRGEAARLKRRQVEEALRKLEARGGLTVAQCETVESMADAILGGILAPPVGSLVRAAAEGDPSTVRVARRTFDLDVDPGPDSGENSEERPESDGPDRSRVGR
jgi:hypothetical protein